jgi:Dolichyl-phosphate-mannose-protein mannosyltransferase
VTTAPRGAAGGSPPADGARQRPNSTGAAGGSPPAGARQRPEGSRRARLAHLGARAAPGLAAIRDPALPQAIAIVAGLRVSLGLVAWGSITVDPITGVGGDHLELLIPTGSRLWPWVGPWQRWDALWYEHIARSGYGQGAVDAAFYPLYPGLVHLLAPLTGGETALAALLLSTVALVAALLVLHRLVRSDLGPRTADRTILYLAAAPAGFFLLAGFTESLFLLLAAGTVLAARRGRPAAAGGLAALAALCRSTGVLLVAPLLVEAVADARRRRREGRRPAVRPAHVAALLPLAAAAGWDLWVRLHLGVAGGGLSLQHDVWGNHPVAPWTALHDSLVTVLRGGHPEEALNLASSLALVLALPLMLGRLPASYAAYTAVSLLPIVCRESLVTPQESSGRYLLAVFPVFVLLARAGRRPWVDRLVLATFPVLLGALVADFAHFGFLG